MHRKIQQFLLQISPCFFKGYQKLLSATLYYKIWTHWAQILWYLTEYKKMKQDYLWFPEKFSPCFNKSTKAVGFHWSCLSVYSKTHEFDFEKKTFQKLQQFCIGAATIVPTIQPSKFWFIYPLPPRPSAIYACGCMFVEA